MARDARPPCNVRGSRLRERQSNPACLRSRIAWLASTSISMEVPLIRTRSSWMGRLSVFPAAATEWGVLAVAGCGGGGPQAGDEPIGWSGALGRAPRPRGEARAACRASLGRGDSQGGVGLGGSQHSAGGAGLPVGRRALSGRSRPADRHGWPCLRSELDRARRPAGPGSGLARVQLRRRPGGPPRGALRVARSGIRRPGPCRGGVRWRQLPGGPRVLTRQRGMDCNTMGV